MRQRFKKGDPVRMNADALDNYGAKYANRVLVVESVSTKYMPASEFFARGKPDGFHPGFDASSGCALYDLEGCSMSLYDWELEKA